MDVGCGSGILAIAALKKGAIVDACDTDPLSVENALVMRTQNGVLLIDVLGRSYQ
jgi:ribosomal protein L11 methyltransferase